MGTVFQSAFLMMVLTGAPAMLACGIRFEVVNGRGEAIEFQVVRLHDRIRKPEAVELPPSGKSPVVLPVNCSFYQYELRVDGGQRGSFLMDGTVEVDSKYISVYRVYDPPVRFVGYSSSRGISSRQKLVGQVLGPMPADQPVRIQLMSLSGKVEVEVVADARGYFSSNRQLLGVHTLLAFVGTRLVHSQAVSFPYDKLVEVTVPLLGER